MAADIVEIFEAFRESKVMLNQNLTYVVLAVWTWSLLQFCIVFRGTHRGRKARISSIYPAGVHIWWLLSPWLWYFIVSRVKSNSTTSSK